MTVGTGKRNEQTDRVSPKALPLVAIVGQPNVGKSTLFNRLIGRRRSIVGDEPGITRDRIYGEVEWSGERFSIVDTGGIIPDDDAVIPASILKQAGFAIDEGEQLDSLVRDLKGQTRHRGTEAQRTTKDDEASDTEQESSLEDRAPGLPREIRLALVGRPNVGKSSLLNRLIGEERVIVSPVAGTTRDAIDTVLETPEQTLRLIDTACIRRKGKTGEMAE